MSVRTEQRRARVSESVADEQIQQNDLLISYLCHTFPAIYVFVASSLALNFYQTLEPSASQRNKIKIERQKDTKTRG
jgi:hypothetical protein